MDAAKKKPWHSQSRPQSPESTPARLLTPSQALPSTSPPEGEKEAHFIPPSPPVPHRDQWRLGSSPEPSCSARHGSPGSTRLPISMARLFSCSFPACSLGFHLSSSSVALRDQIRGSGSSETSVSIRWGSVRIHRA